MIHTTLCYITRGDQVLMLHRVKKKGDMNQDKWIGVGGKFLPAETAEQCLLREVKEETGLTLTGWKSRGTVTFLSDRWPPETMHLFTAHSFTGQLTDCDEGELVWVSRDRVAQLPAWEGDKIFLELLWQDAPFFELQLTYTGEQLTGAVLNAEKIR